MASDIEFVKFVADQLDESCEARYRRMSGEYVLYSKDKVVALICDNRLFAKPTAAGRSFIGHVTESPPYTGSTPAFFHSRPG